VSDDQEPHIHWFIEILARLATYICILIVFGTLFTVMAGVWRLFLFVMGN
jgi:hypothetical protein